jgi:hypothetical protein
MSAQVKIIMGSDSDLPVMQAAADILDELGVTYEMTIVSAHRTPHRLVEFSENAHKQGIEVYRLSVYLLSLQTRLTDGIQSYPSFKCQAEYQWQLLL